MSTFCPFKKASLVDDRYQIIRNVVLHNYLESFNYGNGFKQYLYSYNV